MQIIYQYTISVCITTRRFVLENRIELSEITVDTLLVYSRRKLSKISIGRLSRSHGFQQSFRSIFKSMLMRRVPFRNKNVDKTHKRYRQKKKQPVESI